jgi:hypothetical protein
MTRFIVAIVLASGPIVSAQQGGVAGVSARNAAAPSTGEPELEVQLRPRFVSSQGFVRSMVRVLPHPDNRLLRMEIDSENYYRSSDIQLEGANAARIHSLDWAGLPPGNYQVVATVFGPDGARKRETVRFEVLGVPRPQTVWKSPTVSFR